MDVTSIGDINVDIITSNIQDFPERDAQEIIDEIHISSGGCAANFAKASARLGLKTRFIGKLGKDILGDFVRKELGIENLDLKISTGTKTGVTIAITFLDHSRSFLTYPGSNSELTIEDIDFDLIQGGYVHIASFFLQGLRNDTKRILDYAHENGILTSFDTGFDPSGWSKKDVTLVRKILSDVDIFFPNLDEARAITGCDDCDEKEDVCEQLLLMGPEIIALKMGSKGSYICTEDERVSIPPTKLDVIDTTGAGDVFDASFIFGHSKGWDLKKIGRFSNTAAAISTTGFGTEKYPNLGEVLSLSNLSI